MRFHANLGAASAVEFLIYFVHFTRRLMLAASSTLLQSFKALVDVGIGLNHFTQTLRLSLALCCFLQIARLHVSAQAS